ERMIDKALIRVDRVPDTLLSNLENRDTALWIRTLPEAVPHEALISFLGLPWRLILSEVYDPTLIGALESAATFDSPMTRKRGFVQVIDSDPSRIELPQRCLPLYLLNACQGGMQASDFEGRLRRLTMLEDLRRSGARDILVISSRDEPLPSDLKDLWSSGFRSRLTFASQLPDAEDVIHAWLTGA